MTPIVSTAEQRRGIERRREKNLDRRVYQRLTAVLTVAEGKGRDEVAHVPGIGLSQLGEWLRLFRNEGLDALCTLHYRGDPSTPGRPEPPEDSTAFTRRPAVGRRGGNGRGLG
jgi:hypothetical protein